jgi:putative endonuclease
VVNFTGLRQAYTDFVSCVWLRCHAELVEAYIIIKKEDMKFYYVYIVKCSDNSYYTGMTNSIDRRLFEHNSGKNPDSYTFSRKPVVLVWFESFSDPTQAIIIEKKNKGWSRRKKEALINEDWDKLVLYSKNYTEFGKNGSSTGSD